MRRFPAPYSDIPDKRSAHRFLLSLASENRLAIGLGIGYGVVCMLSQAFVPYILSHAIDTGLIARDSAALVRWAGIIVALAVVQATASIMRDRCAVANRLGASFRTLQHVTRQTTRLGTTTRAHMSTGDIVTVGVADISQVGATIAATSRGAGAIAAIMMISAIMLATSWRLGAIVVLGVPIMAWLTARLMRPLQKRQQRVLEQQGALTGRAIDIASGLRVLRGIGGEEVFARRYRADSQRVRDTAIGLAGVEGWLSGITILLPGLLTVCVLWVGSVNIDNERLSPGQLIAFYGYAAFMAVPLSWLTETVDTTARGLVSARRIVDFLSLTPEFDAGHHAKPAPESGLAILTDPESGLVIEPGTMTAVVCAEPSDAAVLVDRLGRYTHSDVSYGPVPLSAMPLPEVRRRILVADNDARLFAGTLRTELDPRGHAHDSDRPLWQAVQAAAARDIIEALPEGFDAPVGESARNFSGGQLQRLRLTRALMAAPEILILVDPTSSVDAHTEARIAGGLADARAGGTTVVFTTSPILLGEADRVCFVESTRVTGTGTHMSLLADPGYRSFVTREVDVR